jgi:tetratricopeptide (TPR) repeat protein
LPIEKVTMVRLAASSLLARTGKHQVALAALEPVFEPASKASESQRKLATQLCLYIGSEALSAGKPELADRAYSLAAAHAEENVRPTALLGAAWATAMQKTKPAAAAERLAGFVESYPQHADAARAAALQVTCLRQAKLNEEADAALADLLDRWPASTAAAQLVAQYRPEQQIPLQIESWLLARAAKEDLSGFSPVTTATGLLAAARTDSEDAWNTFAGHLAATDELGGATSDVLQKLSQWELNAYAQRLTASLIAPKPDAPAHAANREAACRWAGRNELWSMLALAAESSDPETDEPTRTPAIERLFAEALMQSGRPEDAQAWWNHLVDVHQVKDFPTLIRCAETATSLSDIQQADERIKTARAAAGDHQARLALVDMLEADLDIRRLEFDRARTTLEGVVQSSQSVASLRGRAQWMIGETYFLQEKFVDAIEAYRRVEGIDPQGPWVAVALVQAGKSFEQLGRTREASVCYSTLVSRYADSQHASVARRRLAEISPTPASNSPQPTIRR